MTTDALAGARARSLAGDANNASGRVRALADTLAYKALTMMGDAMADEKLSDSARRGAARDVMYVWSRIPQPEKTDDPATATTPEELERRLEATIAVPEVRAWLVAHGWTPPIETVGVAVEEGGDEP